MYDVTGAWENIIKESTQQRDMIKSLQHYKEN